MESISILVSSTAKLRCLTQKQKGVIAALSRSPIEGRTMTSMVREISRRYGFSEPTVRRTFQQLRSLGLIRCGFEEKKGLPLRITEIGQLLFAKISKGIELQEVPKLRWKSKYYVIDIS